MQMTPWQHLYTADIQLKQCHLGAGLQQASHSEYVADVEEDHPEQDVCEQSG